ncbi:copper resistance CopC family protein [Corynebacterium sp. AOP40-9SA-29]|uniref:copper resistance CopC family protein n=1 Tax=Corynebacterium sp. AOP40-9SA-29 TaxID=3457677 RepID=UPI004034A200
MSRQSSVRPARGVRPRVVRAVAAPVLAAAMISAPVFLGAGVTGGLPVASAHDAMVGATPEPDSALTDPPTSIELEFSGIPQDNFNTVALSRDGEVVYTGEPTIDERMITLDIPDDVELEDGVYTVGYQITSSDGHGTRGDYTFTLGDVSAADAETSSEDDGLPTWAITLGGIAGVIVVLGALVVVIARFRSISSEDSDESGDKA